LTTVRQTVDPGGHASRTGEDDNINQQKGRHAINRPTGTERLQNKTAPQLVNTVNKPTNDIITL